MTDNHDHEQPIPGQSKQPMAQPPGYVPISPIPPLGGWNGGQWNPPQQYPPQTPAPYYAQPTWGPMPVPYGAPQAVVVIGERKSLGAALVLSFLFGPLGMLYATVTGALVMFAINVVLLFVTLGIGWLLTWPICMIWAASAVSSHNGRLAPYRYLPPR